VERDFVRNALSVSTKSTNNFHGYAQATNIFHGYALGYVRSRAGKNDSYAIYFSHRHRPPESQFTLSGQISPSSIM
jgi:hypothetical protein